MAMAKMLETPAAAFSRNVRFELAWDRNLLDATEEDAASLFEKMSGMLQARRRGKDLVLIPTELPDLPTMLRFVLDDSEKLRTDPSAHDAEIFLGTWLFAPDGIDGNRYDGPRIPKRASKRVTENGDALVHVLDYTRARPLELKNAAAYFRFVLDQARAGEVKGAPEDVRGLEANAEEALRALEGKISKIPSESEARYIGGALFETESAGATALELIQKMSGNVPEVLGVVKSLVAQTLFTLRGLRDHFGFFHGDLYLRNLRLRGSFLPPVSLVFEAPGERGKFKFEASKIFAMDSLKFVGADNAKILSLLKLSNADGFRTSAPGVSSGHAADLNALASDVLVATAFVVATSQGPDLGERDAATFEKIVDLCLTLMYTPEGLNDVPARWARKGILEPHESLSIPQRSLREKFVAAVRSRMSKRLDGSRNSQELARAIAISLGDLDLGIEMSENAARSSALLALQLIPKESITFALSRSIDFNFWSHPLFVDHKVPRKKEKRKRKKKRKPAAAAAAAEEEEQPTSVPEFLLGNTPARYKDFKPPERSSREEVPLSAHPLGGTF